MNKNVFKPKAIDGESKKIKLCISDYWCDVTIVSTMVSKEKSVSRHSKVFCILYICRMSLGCGRSSDTGRSRAGAVFPSFFDRKTAQNSKNLKTFGGTLFWLHCSDCLALAVGRPESLSLPPNFQS